MNTTGIRVLVVTDDTALALGLALGPRRFAVELRPAATTLVGPAGPVVTGSGQGPGVTEQPGTDVPTVAAAPGADVPGCDGPATPAAVWRPGDDVEVVVLDLGSTAAAVALLAAWHHPAAAVVVGEPAATPAAWSGDPRRVVLPRPAPLPEVVAHIEALLAPMAGPGGSEVDGPAAPVPEPAGTRGVVPTEVPGAAATPVADGEPHPVPAATSVAPGAAGAGREVDPAPAAQAGHQPSASELVDTAAPSASGPSSGRPGPATGQPARQRRTVGDAGAGSGGADDRAGGDRTAAVGRAWRRRHRRDVGEGSAAVSERIRAALQALADLDDLLADVPLLADPDGLVQRLVRHVATELSASSVGLWSPAAAGWRLVAYHGPPVHPSTRRVAADQPLLSALAGTGSALLFDPATAAQDQLVGLAGTHTEAVLAAALPSGRTPLGVLVVGCDGQVPPARLDRLVALAAEVAPGLALARRLVRDPRLTVRPEHPERPDDSVVSSLYDELSPVGGQGRGAHGGDDPVPLR